MKVSVITVVKDHALGLKATIDSVLRQTFSDWEMLIVVGPSNDDTMRIAQEIQAKDSRVQVITQNGAGIYEAMNEGIRAASGEFTWFMNAGDQFGGTEVLNHATAKLSLSNVGMLIGGYQIDGASNKQTYVYPEATVSIFNFAFTRRAGCHQAMIFRTKILKDMGGFNSAYSLASDFDLVLKVIKSAKALRVSEVYATIEPGGRADQGIFNVHRQKHAIRRKALGGPIIYITSVLWTGLARAKIILRRFLRKLLSK